MKVSLVLILTTLALVGCAHRQEVKFSPVPGTPVSPNTTTLAAPASSPAPVVTPGNGLTGKVSRYNSAGRFVVLEFPVGHLPSLEQRLFVYRNGLKVGEVKVTGPQRDDHIVADLAVGEATAGDEVRDK